MGLLTALLFAAAAMFAAPGVASAAPGPVYADCSEARADGVYNIPQDDPAYWEDGDRDGDGFACEPPQ